VNHEGSSISTNQPLIATTEVGSVGEQPNSASATINLNPSQNAQPSTSLQFFVRLDFYLVEIESVAAHYGDLAFRKQAVAITKLNPINASRKPLRP
jgi:hypothetical protein